VDSVNFTLTISSAPAPSNPGPSSSSGSSFGTTITVPVSGEENTVHVDAKVTGQSAKVEPVDAKEVEHISEGQTEMPVTMDFSGLKKTITEVKIPTQSVELIAEAANDKENKVSGLKVELSKAGVEFDAKALETVAAAAKNADDITLIVDERAANKLTDAQQKTIKDMPNKLILEATLLINGTPVHDFKGGSVTVTFDYELAANQKAEHITVWHVADDGTKEAMQTRYDAKEKVVRFVAPHFSHYVVTGDEANYQHVCPSESYTDVDQSLWYHESVDYVIETGLMFGYGNGIFKPNGTVTRQQVWMTLARLNGAAPVNMVEARTWAMEHGVSDGTNPTAYITRQQFIAMLWRYAKDMGYDVSVGEDTNILSYTDAFDIAEYAVPAMQWGCGAGVMGGYTDGSLKPTATTTRAHMAAFLQRFCEKAVK